MARRFWWVGAAVLAGAAALVLVVTLSRHYSTSSPAPSPPAAAPPAALPDFEVDAVSVLEGKASWYDVPERSLPQRRAWPGEFTAASDRIAPNTYARVRRTNAKGDPGKSVVVRITDHGVGHKNTVVDLDRGAAEALDMVKAGQVQVRVEVLALKNATVDKPVVKKTDPPLTPKASEITDQPTATRQQEKAAADAKANGQGTP